MLNCYHVITLVTNCMSISCDYSWHFLVIGFQYVNSFMPGCLVRNNVAPFLVKQLVLSTPWMSISCLLRSMMHVLITETSFISLLSCLWCWLLLVLRCDYFLNLLVIGIKYANRFMPSCLVRNIGAPFLVEQCDLSNPPDELFTIASVYDACVNH